MKKLTLILTLVFCASAFAQKNVAVLEIERRGVTVNEISREEAMEITGVIRGAAVHTLPRGQYSVMTSETVQAMGGAALAECFDETCVIALGRTIDAEYVVRGVLSKFQTVFTLNIEMFETEYGNLVATSAPVRSENLMEILSRSELVSVEMFRKFLETGTTPPQAVVQSALPEQPSPEPIPQPMPEPITQYRLSVNANPSLGGMVSVNPNQDYHDAGSRVRLTANPAGGHRFDGWTGVASNRANVTVTLNNDTAITANFRELPPQKIRHQREKRPPRNFEHFFALRWMPLAGRDGVGVNAEYGQIRRDVWLLSMDGGVDRINQADAGGMTYNLGRIHELATNMQFAYGVSYGAWGWPPAWWESSPKNEFGNVGGAFVRYRWHFFEVKYRGLFSFEDDSFINQLMLGFNFTTNRHK